MHKFFTGPQCAGCKTLKQMISAENKSNQFEFIDVSTQGALALRFAVRSLPTIVATDGTTYVGVVEGSQFVKAL